VSVAGVVALVISGLASLFAGLALWYTRKATTDTGRLYGLARVYDGYEALSSLRLQYWEQAHLLELPANYDRTVAQLKSALGPLTAETCARCLLNERAVATRIFALYEEAWNSWQQAWAAGDAERERILADVVAYFAEKLVANQRLRYLWLVDGGNLRVYIQEDAQLHYEAQRERFELDRVGPYEVKN
jgi:hypothetical protein